MAISSAILETIGFKKPNFELILDIHENDACMKSEKNLLIKKKVTAHHRISSTGSDLGNLNPLPHNKILDQSKLKQIANDIVKCI